MSSRKLTKLMTEAGLLPEDAANKFLEQEKSAEPLTLDSMICKDGFAEPFQLDYFLADAFRLPKVDLPEVLSPQKEALDVLDAEQVAKFQVFPYAVDEENLWLVAALPLRLTRIQTLSETTARNLKISPLNQVYFALLAEQYYQIAPPEELIPLIDEWPLPIPEEAADMIYTPPPKEAKKKTKSSEKSDGTDAHAADDTASSFDLQASSAQESPSLTELPASPPASAVAAEHIEKPQSTEPTESTATSITPEASASPVDVAPSTTENAALTTPTETNPLSKEEQAKRAAEEAKLALMDVTDILGFEMTELLGGTMPTVHLDDLLGSSTALPTTTSLLSSPALSAPATEIAATTAHTEATSQKTSAQTPFANLDKMPSTILPLGVYEAEYLLRNALTRDGVLELGLYFFATKLQHAALFLIRKQSAKGLRMIGSLELDKAFQEIEISLDASAFFSAMLNALVPYSGSPSEEEADRPLFSLFPTPPKHVYLLPIRVRGRTVALLYGHTAQEALSSEDFEQLIRCTYQMAQSLEHVILAVKKGITEESTTITQALNALRQHDPDALRAVLQQAQYEIDAIAAESIAAIERVQAEEKRIAQERADKLARAAELARAAREQAALQATTQTTQTTDFLDATDNPVDLHSPNESTPLTQTGDFAEATAPVTQTGDFAEATAPVTHTSHTTNTTASLTQTGDLAVTTAPVTQTGDLLATTAPVTQTGDLAEATVPVTQTGDFAQPTKETVAYLSAFVVDDETRKKLSSQTAESTEEKKTVASEDAAPTIPHTETAQATTEAEHAAEMEIVATTAAEEHAEAAAVEAAAVEAAAIEAAAVEAAAVETAAVEAETAVSFTQETASNTISASDSASTEAEGLTPTHAADDAPTRAEDDALPELMPAFDEPLLLASQKSKSSDVIGAEITSSGDSDGAEISSNTANPNASLGDADALLATMLSTDNPLLTNDESLLSIAEEGEALGTPTPSQQEIQALADLPQDDERAEETSPTAQQVEESETIDPSFLLIGTLHAPPALPDVHEEVAVLLPMLNDDNERIREVALQSFRDMPREKSVAALLSALFQELQPEDIREDGQLSADKQDLPIHTLYQRFLDHKEAAATALCHQLYHNSPEQHALTLRILSHLPLTQSVWPHLMHFVLRLDEHLAKPSLSLLEQHKEDPTLQEIAIYLRDQITTEQPDYGARVLRLLQKLHTPELTKATRRFLHIPESNIAEMAARLTLLSLREQANQDALPPAPPTPHPLSIEHIFSLDLEDPPALPAPDPLLNEMIALLALPGETLHREVVLVLRDMPPQRLTHTLLHHFPGSLELSDFNDDGELSPQKQKTPDGYIWLLLCQTPESTQGHLLPFLAHKQPRIRLLTLQLLQIFPSFDPLLPYLFRYLLDFNALIVETSRKLLRQMNHSMTFQRILEWMREQLEYSDPTQAIRAVKVLAVLRDTVAVPNLIELVQHEDRELAEAATQALQLITKQILPAQHKQWSKWWNKVGSRSERVDWLIEAIQLKDETIIQAANQELIELTGQDFGLSSETGRRERSNVIQQWKTWRKQHPIF